MRESIELTRIRLVKGRVDEEMEFVTEFAIRNFDRVETEIIRYESAFYVFSEMTDDLYIYRRVEEIMDIAVP